MASSIKTSTLGMCWSTSTATYGSPALGLRPNCRTSVRRPRHRRSSPAPWLTWRPSRPAAFLTALAEEGLLRFDPDAATWIWDLERIRSKGYTDNVVDLMVGKLKRLSGATQTALQQFACLGNVVEIAALSLVFGKSEEEIHTALWEAARGGLILRLEAPMRSSTTVFRRRPMRSSPKTSAQRHTFGLAECCWRV